MLAKFDALKKQLDGELFLDKTTRTIYATDASVYKETPQAVAFPTSVSDLKRLINFANETHIPLVPRTAGTSLAGQVVGGGIIVDVSRHFTNILEVNTDEKWVRVQPGVIRDELNLALKEHDLFFAPETSTANRCMVGGMVGNNSCGAHSVLYGTTREHVIEIEALLSDGSEVTFGPLSTEAFQQKCKGDTLENKLYRHINELLSDEQNRRSIEEEYPKKELKRRNTGYAIDVLARSDVFTAEEGQPFNFCKLLAGSEGTLAFITAIKFNLEPLPPKERGVVAIHCHTIDEALRANIIALQYKPGAVEMMDKIILDCTKENKEQQRNRFFVEGDPAAIICVEFARETREEISALAEAMETELQRVKLGYHFPLLFGNDVNKVWDLRKAGLGLLANMPGDPKAVACIEDTAVDIHDMPEYIREFQEVTSKYGKECVYYAHVGDGELHLRPVLDLKVKEDRELFFNITNDVATLVKKYRGSLSGEHGDGRVRGEFVKKMVGDHNYELLIDLKKTWDPNQIFNPGKIVHAPKMNESLRYDEGQQTPDIDTIMDFSETKGIVRMAEKCNGTGVCRKSHVLGGTMCPSYMATKNEYDTTRARANMLREVLNNSPKQNRFDDKELYNILDLCLSCKGCQSECPSNVDVAMMKSEFLHHYHKANGTPINAFLIGKVADNNAFFSHFPWLFNTFSRLPGSSQLIKAIAGIAPQRDLPLLYKTTLRKWAKKQQLKPEGKPIKKVLFFADEVINYNDVPIGIAAIDLLVRLGYEVVIPEHKESGRPAISKGLLTHAKRIAEHNVKTLSGQVSASTPLVGVEPSAILTFRDEYTKLVNDALKPDAKKMSDHCLVIDEFLAAEFEKGNISKNQFNAAGKHIKLHGHCHQKALSEVRFTKEILSIPEGNEVEVIPSGCCGMSGSFGYDKKHYDVSMKIGELVLFPAVRQAGQDTIIAAPGTSCRHQIMDGTGKRAMHPVEVLLSQLK